MAELSLVYPAADQGAEFEQYDADGNLLLFVFDATLGESHTVEVDWTEHPVEDGAVISDHAVVTQETVSFTGTLSRTSLATNPRIANEPGRLEQAAQTLLNMAASKNRVTAFTPFRVLEDYRISAVTINRSPDAGQAAEFNIDLKKITVVSSEQVDIPPALVKAKTRNQATKEGSAGTQTATQTDADTEAGQGDPRSWGVNLSDFFTGR